MFTRERLDSAEITDETQQEIIDGLTVKFDILAQSNTTVVDGRIGMHRFREVEGQYLKHLYRIGNIILVKEALPEQDKLIVEMSLTVSPVVRPRHKNTRVYEELYTCLLTDIDEKLKNKIVKIYINYLRGDTYPWYHEDYTNLVEELLK